MIRFFTNPVNRLQRFIPMARKAPLERADLSTLAAQEATLPEFVRACPVAMKYLRLLGPLNWATFPERPEDRPWPGPKPHPRAPFVAAYLIKLNEEKAICPVCTTTWSSIRPWSGCWVSS